MQSGLSAPGPFGRIRAEVRFAARLSLRFARSRLLARSSVVVALSAAFLVAMMMALSALSISGQQVVDRDLGRFGAFAGFGSIPAVPPGDDGPATRLTSAVTAAGATDVMVTLIATDVPLAARSGQKLTLWEGAWASDPFPDRFELVSGRWPSRPGEVVLTDASKDDPALPATVGSSIGVGDGSADLTVVGTADDRYARDPAFLAGRGTWAAFDPALATRFTGLTAQPTVYWAGDAPDAVLGAIDRVAATMDSASGRGALGETYQTRADLDHPESVWIAKSPAGYAVPSFLLPLLAVLLVAGVNDRRLRRAAQLLTAAGVTRRVAGTALAASVLEWCLVAAAVGIGVGVGIGVVLRPIVAAANDRPVGPIGDLLSTALRIFVLLIVGAAVLAARLTTVGGTPRTARQAARNRRLGKDLRQILAAGAWCAVVLFGARVDSAPETAVFAGFLTAAVLLLMPEFVGVVVSVLPERGPRQRLSRRQLSGDRNRVAAATALLALAIGSCLGYLTLFDTLRHSAAASVYSDVLPSQLRVGDRANLLLPPSPQILGIVERSGETGSAHRMTLYTLLDLAANGDVRRQVGVSADPTRLLLAVDTAQQANELVGGRLSPSTLATLSSGGVLIWEDVLGKRPPGALTSLTVTPAGAGSGTVTRTAEIPVASVSAPPVGWRNGTAGLMLTAEARQLNLPITASGPTIFTGLSDNAVAAARDAVLAAGFDLGTLQSYKESPPPLTAFALYATAGGLVVLAILASLTAIRGQVRALRDYLGRLLSIGLSPAWARQVMLLQYGVTIAIATVAGLCVAIPPAVLVSMRISGFVLSIPWMQLLVLLGAVYLGTAASALFALRGLRGAARSVA